MRDESDTHRDREVAERAAREWGVLSVAELGGCGLTKTAIARRVASGRLHPIHRGVYAVGHRAVPLEGEFLAAVKACGPGAVLSHLAAAALWELVTWDGRHPEVTVCDTTPRVHPGIKVHRTQLLEAEDVRHYKHVPVTAPARTALDLCSQLPFKPARRALRTGLSLGRYTIQDLLEIAERQKARPGARRLRGIIAAGVAPTRSELEDVVLELIREAGLPRPEVNVPLSLNGRIVIPDFRWPAWRLVVEADSRTWHENRLAKEDDAERQALLEAHGERVVRVTWVQATAKRAQTIRRLRSAAPGLSG